MDFVGHETFQVNEEGTFNHIWDPQTTWAQEPFELFRCCLLRTLMSFNGRPTNEGGAELRPDLISEQPFISPDGLAWTFRLKPGLHYAPPMADTPIVAADVIRALERTLRPDPFEESDKVQAFGPYAGFFAEVIAGADEFTSGSVSSISGLEAPDATTLVVHLVRPAGDLGARLALPAAAPLPPGAADGHDAGYGRYLVASGPYMIEGSEQLQPRLPPEQQQPVAGYVPGTSLTLVRNPSWSDDDLRQALVDRIEFSQFGDYDDELQAIIDDRLHLSFSSELDPEAVDAARADVSTARRVHVISRPASDYIVMNLAAPPFDDVHVRRALNFATDKRSLAEMLQPGARTQAHAIPDAFENDLLADYNPYATVNDTGSIEQARAEMAKSRYDADADGTCDAAACTAIHIPVRNDSETPFGAAALAFATQIAPLGISLVLDSAEPGIWFDSITDPASQTPLTFTYGWGSDYFNASAWFGPLITASGIGNPDTGGNLSLVGASPADLSDWGYSVTTVPSLQAQVDGCTALTGAAQFGCWSEVDQYVMEKIVPWVPLDTRQTSRLTSTSVTHFSFDTPTNMPALEQITVEPAP